jgi:hypothetical protein
MKKLLIILICVVLYSCSTNTSIVKVNKTETKKITPTIKYFNKKLNSKKYGLVTK